MPIECTCKKFGRDRCRVHPTIKSIVRGEQRSLENIEMIRKSSVAMKQREAEENKAKYENKKIEIEENQKILVAHGVKKAPEKNLEVVEKITPKKPENKKVIEVPKNEKPKNKTDKIKEKEVEVKIPDKKEDDIPISFEE